IAATLFHQGAPLAGSVATAAGRTAAGQADLSAAGRQAVETGLRQVGRLSAELDPLRRQLDMLSRRQPGCRALRDTHYGIGAVTAVAIWAELGDVRRFGNSDDVVRHTGLDITVYSSDTKRSAGHLSRQGPELLRWALYEAAKLAARPAAPDHGYYTATRHRRSGGLATLSAARKAPRRCHPPLRTRGGGPPPPPAGPPNPPPPPRPPPKTENLAPPPRHSPAARPGRASLQRMSGRTPSWGTPSRIMSPEPGTA